MPRYDYTCEPCGVTREVMHPREEEAPHACPLCSGAMRRLIPFTPTSYSSSSAFNTNLREFPKSGPR